MYIPVVELTTGGQLNQAEDKMAEEETTDASEGIQDFLDNAKDAVGVDLAELLQGMMQANEEDATFRQEVMRRMDILIANQLKMYEILKYSAEVLKHQVLAAKAAVSGEATGDSEVP